MNPTPAHSFWLLFAPAFTLFASTAMAELRLPAIIGHHMVLQRDIENPRVAEHGTGRHL